MSFASNKTKKEIFDAACGSKMFYYDKNNSQVLFNDIREVDEILCDGRKLVIKPDTHFDFRNLPFDNETFSLVIFDPPHLIKIGENSWMAKKYGKLNRTTWKDDILMGFNECYRILKHNGTLIFKWSEGDIKQKEILEILPIQPVIGDRGKGKNTLWLVFFKS